MLIAGDPSGDQLAAELLIELRSQVPTGQFFGAGGPHLQAAGMELLCDLTQYAVIGLSEVIGKYTKLRRIFQALLREARRRRPDVIIGIDFGGFNLRFAAAVKSLASGIPGWRPRIVQFVSPQVWASRPGRARRLAQTHDLILSIVPFEKAWYAEHAPSLRVEFVGHPLVDRHTPIPGAAPKLPVAPPSQDPPVVVLLPGSRLGEIRRHWPVLREAATYIAAAFPVKLVAVLPTENLAVLARRDLPPIPAIEIRVGGWRIPCAWRGWHWRRPAPLRWNAPGLEFPPSRCTERPGPRFKLADVSLPCVF